MTETITVESREFEAAYLQFLLEEQKLYERGVKTLANRIKELAQQYVHKQTETLELDIQIRDQGRDDDGYFVDVGTDESEVEYALYQEFGLKKERHMEAHPFMRPAIAVAIRDGLPIEDE